MATAATSSRTGFQDSLITLQVLFQGLDGCPIDPTDPKIRFFHGFDKKSVDVESLEGVISSEGHSLPLLPVVPVTIGLFKVSFLTTFLEAGLYELEFSGEITETEPGGGTKQHTLVVKGEIEIGEISRLQDFINRVEMGLMDDFPEDYVLDEPIWQWRKDQIFTFLKEAVSAFNSIGPRITNCNLDNFPTNVEELLTTGAKIWALWARSRYEKAIEMDYSDVHSLRIARAEFYKSLADTLYQDWRLRVESFKKATPPTPIGVTSQRLPFRIFRVIGLLPNYQNFFSG